MTNPSEPVLPHYLLAFRLGRLDLVLSRTRGPVPVDGRPVAFLPFAIEHDPARTWWRRTVHLPGLLLLVGWLPKGW